MSNYKWELGTFFSSKSEFNESITIYVVQYGKNLKFKKNGKQRVRVRCIDGCEWEAYCAKLPKEETWQLRKVNDNHTSSIEYNVKIISKKWLNKRIQNSLKGLCGRHILAAIDRYPNDQTLLIDLIVLWGEIKDSWS